MAFNLIERARGAEAMTNRVAVAKSPSNNQLAVIISNDVLTRMGHPTYLSAYIGTGADTGTILLVPAKSDQDGYKVTPVSASSKASKIGISGKRAGVGGSFKTTTVPFTITDTVNLLVTLPLFANLTAEARPAATTREMVRHAA